MTDERCRTGQFPTIYDCPSKPHKECNECLMERKERIISAFNKAWEKHIQYGGKH